MISGILPQPSVALISCEWLPDLYVDDRLLVGALTALAIRAVPAVWSRPDIDWMSFDALVMRSPWDYLQDLASRGIEVVPVNMQLQHIHPQLRSAYRFTPPLPIDKPWFRALSRRLMGRLPSRPLLPGVSMRQLALPNSTIRIYQPAGAPSGAAMVWMHGGGYVLGNAALNDRECSVYARDHNMVVLSVDYRLAPEHPFPAPLDDCFDAWRWLQQRATELGVDPTRVVIAGQSAGGGLAAALVQRICDFGGTQPAGQLLFCPMLDDRTAARGELDAIKHRLWNNTNNRTGWSAYLGAAPGATSLPEFAVPARRADVSGLPATWIGVGDIDLFFDENSKYALRLQEAGVSCTFEVVQGGPHAFESLAPSAPVSRTFMESANRFLQRTLGLRTGR